MTNDGVISSRITVELNYYQYNNMRVWKQLHWVTRVVSNRSYRCANTYCVDCLKITGIKKTSDELIGYHFAMLSILWCCNYHSKPDGVCSPA